MEYFSRLTIFIINYVERYEFHSQAHVELHRFPHLSSWNNHCLTENFRKLRSMNVRLVSNDMASVKCLVILTKYFKGLMTDNGDSSVTMSQSYF